MKESEKYSICKTDDKQSKEDLSKLVSVKNYFNKKLIEIKTKHPSVPLLTDLKHWKDIPAVAVKQGKKLAAGNQRDQAILLGLVAKDRFAYFN